MLNFRPYSTDFFTNESLRCSEVKRELETTFKTNQIVEIRLNLADLTKVRLCNYKLKRLDNQIFDGLSSLAFVDLNGNELSSLNPVIFNPLMNLVELDLSDNCFSKFFLHNFSRLSNLKEVTTSF